MRWRTGPSVYRFCARSSGRDDMPDIVAVVPVEVARLLVVLPEIDRLALVGPLLAAVVTGDHGPAARSLGFGGGHERRPVGCALCVAARLAGWVGVPRVERHALGIDQHLALRGVGD